MGTAASTEEAQYGQLLIGFAVGNRAIHLVYHVVLANLGILDAVLEVLEEKVAHGGHPVLRWMMDNIFIRTDPAGNIKPDKEKSTEKIDGAVATIMALDRAIRCGNDTSASVYDSRGILFI